MEMLSGLWVLLASLIQRYLARSLTSYTGLVTFQVDKLAELAIKTSCRIGKQKKFADEEVKEVHDASSSFMSKAKLNLHENVLEFDEDKPQ